MFYSVLVLHHAFSIEQCFFCLISHIFFSRLCFVCKLYIFNWVEGVRQGARFLFPAGSRLSQHRCSGVTAVPPLLVSGPVRSGPVRVTRPHLPSLLLHEAAASRGDAHASSSHPQADVPLSLFCQHVPVLATFACPM